jgi:hypothetical protein
MEIALPHLYKAREYQSPFHAYMDNGGKRSCRVWHRRAGKDLSDWNNMICRAFERKGNYYYYYPTAKLGRKALWDNMIGDGTKFMDFIPNQLIVGKPNQTEMKVKLANGSIIQILGTDNLDVVGVNPVGIVFSEYSKQDPRAWQYSRPILAENGGWASFNFTPRGKNHAYTLYNLASANESWFCQSLTCDDTHAITQEALDEERKMGMSQEMFQQEFFCSFDFGVEGTYYGRYITKAWQEGRISDISHDPAALVHTSWDLGVNDTTAIWFFQLIGNEIHLIDFYESFGEGLRHYKNILDDLKERRGFIYGKHFAPHDVKQRVQNEDGNSKLQIARNLGLNFTVLKRSRIEDGIERCRMILDRCHFDQDRCKQGIAALEDYHKQKKDDKSGDNMPFYSNKPDHNWASNPADSFRYLAQAVSAGMTGHGMTREKHSQLMNRHKRPA